MIASCGLLENEMCQFSREERVTLTGSVETLGVGLGVNSLGARENASRKNAR